MSFRKAAPNPVKRRREPNSGPSAILYRLRISFSSWVVVRYVHRKRALYSFLFPLLLAVQMYKSSLGRGKSRLAW